MGFPLEVGLVELVNPIPMSYLPIFLEFAHRSSEYDKEILGGIALGINQGIGLIFSQFEQLGKLTKIAIA